MNKLIEFFNKKYGDKYGKTSYPRTTLQIYRVYQTIKSYGIEDEELTELLHKVELPKPRNTEEWELYVDCLYNIDDSELERKFKDAPKGTSIEEGKIYLLKENGDKIDEGTELPSIEEQVGENKTIQIFTDLATTEVSFSDDKTIVESLDTLIDTVDLKINQVFRGQSYAKDNPISGNCEIQIEILKTEMNNGTKDYVCQITLTSVTDAPYKWIMLTRRTAGATSSRVCIPLTPMITDVNKEYVDNSLKNKVDKVEGKGLSTVDFTTAYETKLKKLENYNDTIIKNDIEDINTQLEDIAKQIENVGQPTQEQINTAIDQAIEDGKITGSGGINSTAKTLLQTILQNAIYTTNQSENINALITALSTTDPTVTTYTITNTLTNCTNGNANTSVAENTSYIATITANNGYKLDSVTVTMGGTDVTSTMYSNGKITINNVTGNIVITATAIESSSTEELITDGLRDEFDFRACEYNNNYPGNATIVKATRGNGGLYNWHVNCVTSQDTKYGLEVAPMKYSANGTTSEGVASDSFTQVFKSYLPDVVNPMLNSNYASLSNTSAFVYHPKYINTSNSKVTASTQELLTRTSGWFTIILVADSDTKLCKLYVNENLVDAKDGNDYDDFSKWDTSIVVGLLNGAKYCTYFSLYDRALTEVEIVDTFAYLKSLEV